MAYFAPTLRYSFVTQSGNLNFLDPSGPVQACNGTALRFFPLPYNIIQGAPK